MTAPTFIFFGGKGGVGKTTCAAARAVVEAARGADVLVISTDPAHSLGDALAARVSARATRVPVGRTRGLFAVELDAGRALARWVREHRHALGEAIERGTWLDRDDIAGLLDLTMPGVDELVAMLEIVRLAGEHAARDRRRTGGTVRRGVVSRRTVVIVDTAPTGHTMRLLAAPGALAAIARLLDGLQERHRTIRREFGAAASDAPDALLDLMAKQAESTAALLHDRSRAIFEWVTLAESMSLEETTDAIDALRRAGIHLRALIVNRVVPDGPPCELCDRRRTEERRVVAALRRTIRAPVRLVPAELIEPRGAARLHHLGRALAGNANRHATVVRATGVATPPRLPPDKAASAAARAVVAGWGDARVLFFGGKGGVGKTTCAAAAALELARQAPDRRILLLSTDPAHSLGDVLRVRAGDRPMPVAGVANLFVRELDAPAAFAARRTRLETALSEIARSFGAGAAAGPDGSFAEGGLVGLAPPGIDELFGVLTVVDERQQFPLIVVDTAPTGHTLRLLELPDIAREWVQLLMRVLLKYRALVKPGELAKEVVGLSRSIREFQALLADPAAVRFVTVTRAAELPRLETERLLRRLRAMRLASPAIIVNALTRTTGRCPRCRATRAAERRELDALSARCGGRRRRCAIIEAPLAAPPPIGSAALDAWAAHWTA